MTEEVKVRVCLSFRKKIALITLIVLILVSLEVYAHMYVQIHSLGVISEDEAIRSFPFGQSTGMQFFDGAGCRWLVVWRADEASISTNYGFISVFKLEQNNGFFTLNIGIVVAKLEPVSNNSEWFSAELDEVLYESNRTDARIKYFFGEIGTYQIDFGLVIQVYEQTILATLLREEVRVPLETTIYYGPR